MDIPLEDHTTPGTLGVFHLKRFWSRCLRDRAGLQSNTNGDEWNFDNVIYHGLHLPIEETVGFLYHRAPTFEEFEAWVLKCNGGVISEASIAEINTAILNLATSRAGGASADSFEQVLKTEQVEFWDANGYLVVSDLFTAADVKAAEDSVWHHLGMDPNDRDTWYKKDREHGIMVQLFHHPALESIRRSPKLKAVFESLWGTRDLLVSTDRVSFNPPERPGFEFPGPRLHWDVSLDLPIPFGVQGLVYLSDTVAEQGAFTCIPGFHTRIETWLADVPAVADPRAHVLEHPGAVPIPGRAGDLVVWHQALPHGSSPNRAQLPRIVQYVTMFPADTEHAKNWK